MCGSMSFQLNDPKRPAISSKHPGGANVVLGDASTRFLRESITPGNLRALITINGGEGKHSRPGLAVRITARMTVGIRGTRNQGKKRGAGPVRRGIRSTRLEHVGSVRVGDSQVLQRFPVAEEGSKRSVAGPIVDLERFGCGERVIEGNVVDFIEHIES